MSASVERCRSHGRLLAGLLVLATGACSDPTSSNGTAEVAVAFSTSSSTATVANGNLVLQGSNGTLVIEELQVVVDKFELKRTETSGCAEENHSCEKFRAPPLFIDVPLTGGAVIAITQPVEPGTYRRLKFEIEDLDDEDEADDTPTRREDIRALRAAILAQYPEWPREASIRVRGTFTPTGGSAQPFTVYFEAEVELERALVPPAVVTDEGAGATFTVVLDPALWFGLANGTVRNLAQLDYATTGRVEEFEVEIENGLVKVEFDDD